MISQEDMPNIFWAEEVGNAADVRNSMRSAHIKKRTVYELVTLINIRNNHLRVFGCKAWFHIQKKKWNKLSEKDIWGALISWFESVVYNIWLPQQSLAVKVDLLCFEEKGFHPSEW